MEYSASFSRSTMRSHQLSINRNHSAMPPTSREQDAARKRKARRADPEYNDRERESRKRRALDSAETLPQTVQVPEPISRHRLEELMTACEDRLSNACMLKKCCCACDCLHPAQKVKTKSITRCPILVAAIKTRLKPPPNLCPEVVHHYDISSSSPSMSGVLLSKRGVVAGESSVLLQFCQACLDSLSNKKRSKAPKFAIANGLYIGELDSTFDDSTMTEHAMVNLSQPTRFMAVVQGGKHSAIRSHAYYFRADPSPSAGLLPREVISTGTIGVTMIGCITPAQRAATMKRYNARVPRLLEQLQWYRSHNELYKPVAVAAQATVESFTSTTSVVLDCSREDADNGGANGEHGVSEDDITDTRPTISFRLSQHLDESRLRHNELQPAHAAVRSDDDEVSLQSVTALVTNFGMEDDIDLTRQILEKRNVVVRRSSGILSDFDKAFWVYSFCELFPFGRGGLDEHRPVTIGLEEFVRYCLRLFSRRFARHPSFSLVAFDVIARQHASQAVFIRGKLSPRSMSDVATVERDQLLRHVKHLEERRIALTANTRLPPPPVAPPPVRALLSAIGTGLRAFFGSNQERGYARTRALSMQLAFGQPAIFFTLTPDCSTSYRVANLAGEMADELLDSDRDTLQECLDFTKVRLGRIATGNPVACAEYFNCVMNVIIRVVLNWDTDKNCSKPGVGLFGVTKAFVSATESQGSTGNLHGHMLIWVQGMAETVDKYYSATKLSIVRHRLLRYVESIASSSFPLESTECPSCASGSLTAVPFTAGAFQRPHKGSSRPSTANVKK